MDVEALIATLKLRDGQLQDHVKLINRTREDMFDLTLALKEVMAENERLRRGLTQPPEPAAAEAETTN